MTRYACKVKEHQQQQETNYMITNTLTKNKTSKIWASKHNLSLENSRGQYVQKGEEK